VLLLSRNRAYEVRSAVVVAPVTSTIRRIPVEVHLGPADGMPRECVVNLDDLLTIPKRLLLQRLTTLSEEKMQEVSQAIKFSLALD
jgi:mRNA interferase MazF